MAKVALAELLLRRKELNNKVEQLKTINKEGLFEVKTGRKAAHEGLDDIIAQVPKVSLNQVTAAYDWHSRQLRRVDAAVQKANWETVVDIPDECMTDFVDNKA